jgi:hypothetical protein
MVHDYSFFGSTADFVIKKEQLGLLPDLPICKLVQLYNKANDVYIS